MSRSAEEFEFVPEAPARVLEAMEALHRTGGGWINLLPGIPDEGGGAPPGRSVGGLFAPAPPVTMCTWMPPRSGRRGVRWGRVGILHPRGRRALAFLRSSGVPLPERWRVELDHERRGLVVRVPPDESQAKVLDWSLGAGTELSAVALTGTWKASVYLR